MPRSALARAREQAEQEALSKAQEVADLKKDLAVAHSDVIRVADGRSDIAVAVSICMSMSV